MIKPCIGIYGRMNAGKSSLLNFLVGEPVAIVAPQGGTTTDPVRRAYELLGYGAVTFIDTAGFDDTGSDVARMRVERSLATISAVDLALFIPSHKDVLDQGERAFIGALDVPHIIVNKPFQDELRDQIATELNRQKSTYKSFFGDHLFDGQRVLLVCPIDSEAPEGRLILPQVQALRAALDLHAMALTVQPAEVEQAIAMFDPHLVVTDSQVFDVVSRVVPDGVRLTSFSILLSELKGDPELYRKGLQVVERLKDGDRILLVEHCSHGTTCEDIARVKIPRLLRSHAGCTLHFDILSGRTPLPEDLSAYSLLVQCGGCMTSARAIQSRIARCRAAHIPITSYGMLLQHLLV